MKHLTKRQKIALGAFVLILVGIGCQIAFHIVSDGTATLLGIASLMIYGTILFHIRK
jgi:hypothetical protein